jgi:Tol biopolymer transport system component
MKRLGVLAAGCGLATTAALGIPAAGAQTTYVTNIVYASHDTPDAAQGRLACDAAQNTTNCHIYVMNTDGAGRAITTGSDNDIDPAFSPDGTRIAFARAVGGPQNSQYDIYVMDASGANLKQLTTEPKDDRYPAWSPDGTKIAFRGYPAVGGAAIFTMNVDGSAQTAIKNTGGGDQPTWSPDGTRIAY